MSEKKATEAITVEAPPVTDQRPGPFWEKYSRPIIYAGSAIILLIAGWYAYKNFIVEPKERAANEMVFAAETLFDKMASTGFNKDSVSLVINGGDLEGARMTGLLKVIKDYGGTAAGNRANFMVGASYLHIREFDKAIKYLKDFDGNGASQVQSQAYKLLGHAYAEQKKTGEALDYYKKAAEVNEKDEFFSADALILAAKYSDATGKSEEAISLFKKLKEKYPTNSSVTSGEVDKYLAKLGVLD